MNAPPPTDRDDRLAALIAQLADQARSGARPDLEAAAAGHPDLASELRELWAVAQFAELARIVPLSATLPQPDGLRPQPETTSTLGDSALPREFGDFELLAELGRGGMGVVYKARQKSLNRVVALKMVREAHLATTTDVARFRAEAEAAARLQHPNIVTVHEVGTHDGQAYFCMEYVEGRTLGQRVAADGPLPPREAARIVAVIARAVQHAHDHGILHRDLKPSNILLAGLRGDDRGSSGHDTGPDSATKVTDFGLAKQTDQTESLTRTGAVVGTPSYMSPEQATGRKDLTPAADVYSLGAILYELLTGRPPFRAAHPVDTLLMVLEQEPVPPRDLNPGVDRDLELVCLKCLQKPSDLRYARADALAADLEAFLAGEPTSVQPGSLGSFVSRLLRETHHAAVLENWGLLWMWHSLMIFLLCLLTQILAWSNVTSHLAYLALWGTGLLTWGAIFWRLRRRGGPVLFVERQIAHAWAGSVVASIGLFVIEVVQKLPSLTLSPVLALLAGMVFFVKAGTLSGQFYLGVLAYFLTAILMAALPEVGHLLFGAVSAVSFFVPGLKYYLQRKRGEASAAELLRQN
ncbi:serine/threonine-protein kinase [Fimbriiglobus ruber]|uniref:non-specific serine/threonine protein kinase n=1 Tax=Fimbriiglobus ruber TaxID=1908690 RepID=A0A225E116_9BACT|nr:serine/threonine-protein kinase [Fimbriiglobus ruber]OWK46863.1 Serine/threonine protein kinase PrkC, regulator of stationary phase [Fimbriiglobus ruber]